MAICCEVQQYRNDVKNLVNKVIDELPLTLPINDNDPAWVILMGIEHERIHLETSSVIIRQLPLSDVTPSPLWPSCPDMHTAPENRLLSVSGGHVTLGKTEEENTYGWDNEYGSQSYQVAGFKASKYLVSNQEYLAFVKADGYRHLRYWDDEGKAWLAYTQATMPRFWRKKDGQWFQRNLTAETPLPLNWPVEVNQLEAKAFCNWKAEQEQLSIRLLTEAEWYLLRQNIDSDSPQWMKPPAILSLAIMPHPARSTGLSMKASVTSSATFGNGLKPVLTAFKGLGFIHSMMTSQPQHLMASTT